MVSINKLSIKDRLMLIVLVTSLSVIVLMAGFVVIYQSINSQRQIRQQLNTLADILGSRSTAAIAFDDSKTAEEILSALALKPNITYAAIELSQGTIFARFVPKPASGKNRIPVVGNTTYYSTPNWAALLSNEIQITRGIFLDGEQIGTLRIVSSLDNLKEELFQYLLLICGMSLICFVSAFVISSELQNVVSKPITDLRNIMETVAKNRDYSVRVSRKESHEFAALIDGFNHMLEQIESRDSKLEHYSTQLENVLETRNLQLSDANQKRILWLETMARFLRHELKNSSAGIKTSLDLVERRLTETEKVQIYLKRARKSLKNMNALLKSAGDASNLEAALYRETSGTRLDLSKLVQEQIETFSLVYPETSIESDCQGDIHILGNEPRIIQLFEKLLSNAMEHSDGSGPITVCLSRRGESALLTVKNLGTPLPDDKYQIFDLFVSFKPPESKSDENFGMGLYIVKLVAESHQGRVEACDLDGETGALFKVYLPFTN